jgi:Zn-dependent M16 (insulinase) family peptidase
MRFSPLLVLAIIACRTAPVPKDPMTPPTTGSPAMPAPMTITLDTLAPGVSVHGFTPTAVYLDGSDKPIGARFVHDASKFTFDYLRIESAPQGYLWVNSFPTSDKGEPHTQEHLLLGKGDRGRKMGSFQAMALAESSAFTDQWRTVYHFHTVAGRDTFWPVFADQLGAMLDADYTDEEIRREVRNFGVDKDDSGKLRLEEKGTVYNEMVRTYESPETALWREALRLVYGKQHPLAYESGGYPDDIRAMTIADIRKFHTDNYHLANMGIIAAFPSAMALGDVLDQTAAVLSSANPRTGKVMTEADLPKPAPLAVTTPVIVDYPYSDTTSPSPVMLVWPATRDLDLTEQTLLDLFLNAFAGDESTTLYKRLIDGKTREIDLGASGVGAYRSDNQGEPIFLSISGVRADRLDAATLEKVRALVARELDRIGKLPAGDPELIALRERLQSRVIDLRRQVSKFLDSPPGFGFRGTSASWDNHLHSLSRAPGFKKSLTLRPELAAIEKMLASPGNPWGERIARWGINSAPLPLAARPSTKLRAELDTARDQRIAAELTRLEQHYQTKGAAHTLAKYQVDYDAQTKILEDAAAKAPLPPLVKSPPMTLDDELHYTTGKVGGVPSFAGTIDSMQSSRVSFAFRVEAVAEDDLMYLAELPTLMSDVGIADGTTVIASEDMQERLRKEILELSVTFDRNLRTGRLELVVSGAGNDVAETKLALGWMARAMFAADWRVDNLPRLRDVVDQAVTSLRERMKGPEEYWVNDPQQAWWRQDWPVHLHARSFLTRAHDLQRLRWQLLDPNDPKVTAEATTFLTSLAEAAKQPRKTLELLTVALGEVTAPADAKASTAGAAKSIVPTDANEPAAGAAKATETRAAKAKARAKLPAAAARWITAAKALSPAARALALAASKDLAAALPDLPDSSLAADWTYLCKQMANDLEVGAPAALAKLNTVRNAIIASSTARIVTVGSTGSQQAIASDLDALVGRLDTAPRAKVSYPSTGAIRERVLQRLPKATSLDFVGLFAPGTSSGVFVNSAPATSMLDTGDDAILDFLSTNQYAGHGAHTLFMKTWAAGLAYSNGARVDEQSGRILYYAERCPLLPQTMRFVIDQLKASAADPNIARYAIAHSFSSRIAADYESRAWDMASNLVDGLTPDAVRKFRTSVLAQTDRKDLAAELHTRMPKVYGKVLPGYGSLARDAIQFVIGPAKQLDAYQDYLHATIGKDVTLYRLYPRDYWIPAKLR